MLSEKPLESVPVKALLVDDDKIALLAFSSVLGERGFEVATATNVADALKLISQGTYDVLLSDLQCRAQEMALRLLARCGTPTHKR
jgi:CheY-like chemotaxis protein